jgi:hypothetical protein
MTARRSWGDHRSMPVADSVPDAGITMGRGDELDADIIFAEIFFHRLPSGT